MKSNIHVETPDGEVLKSGPDGIEPPGTQGKSGGLDEGGDLDKGEGKDQSEGLDQGETANLKPERKDILRGPKSNPDPFANSNLEADQQHNQEEGAGTEITDGEGG